MKKSLIALAALAVAGVASAQSSVTLFGVVDAGISHYTNKGSDALGRGYSASRTALSNSGESSSRLGFRGTEDLGGGMAASFWLEAGLMNDDGQLGQDIGWPGKSVGAADIFNRRSTVSLSGGWGEIRLGRDYVPTFWNDTIFDPFGTVGVGTNLITRAGQTVQALASAATGLPSASVVGAAEYVRASNSIGYFLPPNLGGFYGQLMYAFGESDDDWTTGQSISTGDLWGARIGWSNGPINVAASYSETVLADVGTADLKNKLANIAAWYDFGVAKVSLEYSQSKFSAPGLTLPKATGWLIGGWVPVGAGTIKASYGNVKLDAPGVSADPKANQWALGYVHNLSKRTALYATVARISNKNGAGITVGGPAYAAGLTPKNSTGYDFGLRHAF
jgi:predicted porin